VNDVGMGILVVLRNPPPEQSLGLRVSLAVFLTVAAGLRLRQMKFIE